MTKKLTIAAILLIAAAGASFALDYVVSVADGASYIKNAAGKKIDADIGMKVKTGDTVITGANGYMELEQKGTSTIRISKSTVFSLGELAKGGKKNDVIACSSGSLSYKFKRITGTEPVIRTATVAAGVRGTEVTVYAGVDGSSLFAVTEGLVSVESAGKSVDLAADEGVEVKTGQAPGAKFKLLGKHIDFSKWDEEKFAEFEKDPVGAIGKVHGQFESIIRGIKEWKEKSDTQKTLLDKERVKLEELLKQGGKDASGPYYLSVVLPMEAEYGLMILNLRYYALSAQSLRTFVLGRLYLRIKSRAINQHTDTLDQLIGAIEKTTTLFEVEVSPFLVEADY